MAETLAWPIRIDGNQIATVEIGSRAEQDQNIGVLLHTSIGERPDAPQFGAPQPMGSHVDVLAIQDVINYWFPDYTVDVTAGAPDAQGRVRIDVEVFDDEL